MTQIKDGDMTDETNAPLADGLDSWWKSGAPVDKAAAEEAAVLAENFQAERTARYLESGGADQIGGWIGSVPGSYGARGIYKERGRMWDWR
jgi:hypothetical protein